MGEKSEAGICSCRLFLFFFNLNYFSLSWGQLCDFCDAGNIPNSPLDLRGFIRMCDEIVSLNVGT